MVEENTVDQAIRVYSNYTLNQFDKVFYNGAYHSIAKRGIMLTLASYEGELTLDALTDKVIHEQKDLANVAIGEECWSYDAENNETVFSNYIKGFVPAMYNDAATAANYAIKARTYIILDDGTTIYSNTDSFNVRTLMEKAGTFEDWLN